MLKLGKIDIPLTLVIYFHRKSMKVLPLQLLSAENVIPLKVHQLLALRLLLILLSFRILVWWRLLWVNLHGLIPPTNSLIPVMFLILKLSLVILPWPPTPSIVTDWPMIVAQRYLLAWWPNLVLTLINTQAMVAQRLLYKLKLWSQLLIIITSSNCLEIFSNTIQAQKVLYILKH